MSARRIFRSDEEIAAYMRELSDDDDDDSIVDPDFDANSEDDDDEMGVDIDATQSPPRPQPSREYNWEKIEYIGNGDHSSPELDVIPEFTGQHSVVGLEGLTPYECFKKIFPDTVYDLVCQETNRYAKQLLDKLGVLPERSRYRNHQDAQPADIKALVAIEIGMGLVHKPTLQSYFQDTFWLTKTPGFSHIFTRDQYLLLRSFLHFSNNEDGSAKEDRLFKIRKILDIVQGTYLTVYNSNKEICIDESMVKFKGRLFFKQYLPSKPSSKWGIKIWSLCDSHTGYLLRFQVYTGKEAQAVPDEGLGYRVVTTLLQGFENKGHVIFTDNFYTSVNLYDSLRLQKVGACGTVRVNRKGLPREMKTIKLKRGDLPITWIKDDKTMIASTFQDTGKVYMLATVGNAGIIEVDVQSKKGIRHVKKPSSVITYNKFMGGVDRFDQLCATYPFGRKNKKWYQALWHFVIEVALINGVICYNKQNPLKKLTSRKFREQVIDSLLAGYARKSLKKRGRRSIDPTAARLAERHFIRHYEGKKTQPNCVVCSILPAKCKKKGRGPGSCKRKQTTYYCGQCLEKPALCIIPCFEAYHTKKKYKKVCQCTE